MRYNNYRSGCQSADYRSGDAGCGCDDRVAVPRNCLCSRQTVSPAMAYVEYQPFEDLFSCDEALCMGTLFKCLYKPFHRGGYR